VQAAFPHGIARFSRDGRFLAIPVPTRPPSITIIQLHKQTALLRLEGAMCPAWSPDDSKIAFIRSDRGENTLQIVERRGEAFSAPRSLGGGVLLAAPSWTSDNQSVFVAAARTLARTREIELDRVFLGAGETVRELTLLSEPARRPSTVRGVAID